MPILTAKKSLRMARKSVRGHWTDQEKQRRREMADLMQRRLLAALGTCDPPRREART